MNDNPHKEFYAQLYGAWQAAGPPTYARLVTIMRNLQAQDDRRMTLGSSALHSLINGQNKGLPRWATLSTVIQALHLAAEETGLNPKPIGPLEDWQHHLRQATDRSKKQQPTPSE